MVKLIGAATVRGQTKPLDLDITIGNFRSNKPVAHGVIPTELTLKVDDKDVYASCPSGNEITAFFFASSPDQIVLQDVEAFPESAVDMTVTPYS